MRNSDVILGATIAVLIISIVCVLFYPTVQDFMVGNSLWNGLADFCGRYKAVNIDSFVGLPESPGGVALLSIPYLRWDESELSQLRSFVVGGGKFILMDDFGWGNQILKYLGLQVRLSGKMLLDPLFCYKNPRLPRITDFSPQLKEAGINSVVLNHATVLEGAEPGKVMAWSSSESFLDLDGDGRRSPAEPRGPFAVAAEFRVGKGEVIVVSDPSILINSMVGKDDNRAFLEYITGLSQRSPGSIMVDRLHLEKTPLDESKLKLARAREFLARPPLMLGALTLIFWGISRYLLWK